MPLPKLPNGWSSAAPLGPSLALHDSPSITVDRKSRHPQGLLQRVVMSLAEPIEKSWTGADPRNS